MEGRVKSYNASSFRLLWEITAVWCSVWRWQKVALLISIRETRWQHHLLMAGMHCRLSLEFSQSLVKNPSWVNVSNARLLGMGAVGLCYWHCYSKERMHNTDANVLICLNGRMIQKVHFHVSCFNVFFFFPLSLGWTW